jgi:hypothetical protein
MNDADDNLARGDAEPRKVNRTSAAAHGGGAAGHGGAAADADEGARLSGAAADADEGARLSASSTPGDVVKLNVGGARFETTLAVLVKVDDSMLGRMFSPPCDAMLQPDPADGSIFIDRDGEHFSMLLDFLRGDPPDGPRMQRTIRLLSEAAQEALVQERTTLAS